MQLRPTKAHHFEAFTPRQQTVLALQALADSGKVQLDANPVVNASLETRKTITAINEFDQLARPYREHFPAATPRPTALPLPPDAMARRDIEMFRRWIADIEPILERITELEGERANLRLLQEYLVALDRDPRDLSLLAHPDGLLHTGLYACPIDHDIGSDLQHLFNEVLPGKEHRFLLLVGLPEQAAEIDASAEAGVCLRVEVPPWIAQAGEDRAGQITSRLNVIAHDLAALNKAKAYMTSDQRIGEILADIALLKWYLAQSSAVSQDEKFCQVSGWTTLQDAHQIEDILSQRHVQGFVRFFQRPSTQTAPVQTRDNWWTRPFAPFISLYGTPGEHEVDPSIALVVMVPLLFGYMFPDIGHGALLVLLGTALYQRWPEGRFLVPCGISAMLFGWVFGEVFGFHDLIDPLWLKPLDAPMRVLLAPLAFGIAVILLGLLFSAIEHYWRSEFRIWLLLDAAVLTIYSAALLTLLYRDAVYIVAAGLAWYLAGCLIAPIIKPQYAAGHLLGRLLESLFQLAINTLSFLRVGAFALAHAGISTAVLMVADLMQDPAGFWLVLVILQLAVLALETLIVFVQTTRLVFFEFYIRFLRAEGRVFKPLLPPGSHP